MPKKSFHGSNNVVVTGTPTKIVYKNLQDYEKKAALSNYKFKNDYPTVLVFGGSQGSKSINESLINIIKNKQNTNYNIIWSTGTGGYDEVKRVFESYQIDIDKIENARIVPYIYNMDEIINAVDLVVCRSGAMTITEISKVGKPAIFIPFPYATENHQEYNARVLEKVGAAKIILDKDLTSDVLHKQVDEIISNSQLMEEMGKKAREQSIDNVEEKIYSEIKKVAK